MFFFLRKGHNYYFLKNFLFCQGKTLKWRKRKVSVCHTWFLYPDQTLSAARGSPCSWDSREERSWGQCWLCVGAGALGAGDSGWEVELPQMLFPSVHLLRQGEEGERERRRKT